jgi:hypothetical protein
VRTLPGAPPAAARTAPPARSSSPASVRTPAIADPADPGRHLVSRGTEARRVVQETLGTLYNCFKLRFCCLGPAGCSGARDDRARATSLSRAEAACVDTFRLINVRDKFIKKNIFRLKVEQKIAETTQNASARKRKPEPMDLETSRLESARSLHTELTHSRAM